MSGRVSMHILSPHTRARSLSSARLAKARQGNGWHGMAWFGLVCLRLIIYCVLLKASHPKIVSPAMPGFLGRVACGRRHCSCAKKGLQCEMRDSILRKGGVFGWHWGLVHVWEGFGADPFSTQARALARRGSSRQAEARHGWCGMAWHGMVWCACALSFVVSCSR